MRNWMTIVYAFDEEEHSRAWAASRMEYAGEMHSKLLDYVEDEYLSVRSPFVKALLGA